MTARCFRFQKVGFVHLEKKDYSATAAAIKKKDEMSHRGLIDLLEICKLLHFLNKQWVWPWLLLRVYSMTRHICWEKNKQTKKTGKPNGHWRRFPLNRHGYCSYPLKNSKASWVTALDNYNLTLPCGISLCPVTPELSTFHANKVLISFILNGGPWQEVSRQEIQFQQNSSGRFYHHQALTVSSLTEKKKHCFTQWNGK